MRFWKKVYHVADLICFCVSYRSYRFEFVNAYRALFLICPCVFYRFYVHCIGLNSCIHQAGWNCPLVSGDLSTCIFNLVWNFGLVVWNCGLLVWFWSGMLVWWFHGRFHVMVIGVHMTVRRKFIWLSYAFMSLSFFYMFWAGFLIAVLFFVCFCHKTSIWFICLLHKNLIWLS